MLIDASRSVGGVWAKERLWPGLVSNNLLGTYEYSDFPMDPLTYGLKPGKPIPGDVLHRYLSDYARHFGLERHIQLNSRVLSIEQKPNDTWQLTVARHDISKSTVVTLDTKRLVVATGLTSTANTPIFKGQSSFDRPIFHSIDFPKCRQYSTENPTKRVGIIGSAKSAWDAAYSYAADGVHVDWIIRQDGMGPSWMAPPYVTPFKIWLERIAFTRLFTWLSPCIWGDADGYSFIRRLLHNTLPGRALVSAFWRLVTNDLLTLNAYSSHPSTAKLRPWTDLFWTGSMLSILNYPTNFFDLVKNNTITVHIANIDELSPEGSIHLSTNTLLPKIDLLLCATGWSHVPNITFLSSSSSGQDLAPHLGLPHHTPSPPDFTSIDTQILTAFPSLRSQPPLTRSSSPSHPPSSTDHLQPPNTSYNLHRFLIPPSTFPQRTIAFLGCLTTLSTALVAQTQALWTTAYFSNLLLTQSPSSSSSPSHQSNIEHDATLHNRFGKFRCPAGYGPRFPDFVFDTVPYVDLLLGDLGVERRRKVKGKRGWWGWGWVREVVGQYGPGDYRGLVGEWVDGLRRRRRRAEGGGGELGEGGGNDG
ncbi:MAG: hypothetical protein Q9227_004249 [Pyrenula ochraceoflavens]